MQPFAADHPILEIAADRAGRRQPLHVGGQRLRLDRIAALEVDRDRQVHRGDDALGIGQSEVERQSLGIFESVRRGDRSAAGRDRAGARLGHGLGAAGVPGIVEDDGVARPVQRGEQLGLVLLGHAVPL